MMTTQRTKFLLIFATMVSLLLSACGPSAAELTPTVDANMIRTEAVSTFAFSLTQTALAAPTNTPTLTPSPTKSPTPITTGTRATGGQATSSCYGFVWVADVTVPDNTQKAPGEKFTKTWRVQNTGSCAWAPGFKFSLIGGDAMGAQALTLTQAVQAGATTELSLDMTAPANQTGKIQGTWRMADANGNFFGGVATVVIAVGGATSTPTTPTVSPTPKETP